MRSPNQESTLLLPVVERMWAKLRTLYYHNKPNPSVPSLSAVMSEVWNCSQVLYSGRHSWLKLEGWEGEKGGKKRGKGGGAKQYVQYLMDV